MSLAIVSRDPLDDAAAEHRGFVRARLGRLGVPRRDLDDATQDAFEILALRIDTYDPARGSTRAYLGGIARRVAARYRREPEDAPYEDSVRDEEADPERAVARSQAWAVLERFLDGLDQDRWTVFVLSELEGLSGPEIADELSTNVNTVYARLRSARKDLARAVKREHARQRGPLGWLLGPFAAPRRMGTAVAGLGAVIGGTLAVIGTLRGCAGEIDDEVERASSPAVGVKKPSRPQEGALRTTRTRASAEDGEPAPGPSGRASAEMGWTSISTNTLTTPNAEIVSTGRYRTEGDQLELEFSYWADDPVDMFPNRLSLEGFVLVEGSRAWSVQLEPDEPRIVRAVLRAVEEGVVRFARHSGFEALETKYDATESKSEVAFRFDGTALQPCGPDACPRVATPEDEDLAGEVITARVRNECTEAIEVALFAGPAGQDPPSEAPRHRLAAGEEAAFGVDANTRVFKMQGGRSVLTAGLSGSSVVSFWGEACTAVTTRTP